MRFSDPAERLAAMTVVDPDTGCHVYTGALDVHGYGYVHVRGRKQKAHRFTYERVRGVIPAGLELDHLCRRPACVNPAHLEAVTHAENVKRGEGGTPRRSKTHCPKGHSYEGRNLITYEHRGGLHRACRTCRQERERVYQRGRRARLAAAKRLGAAAV